MQRRRFWNGWRRTYLATVVVGTVVGYHRMVLVPDTNSRLAWYGDERGPSVISADHYLHFYSWLGAVVVYSIALYAAGGTIAWIRRGFSRDTTIEVEVIEE